MYIVNKLAFIFVREFKNVLYFILKLKKSFTYCSANIRINKYCNFKWSYWSKNFIVTVFISRPYADSMRSSLLPHPCPSLRLPFHVFQETQENTSQDSRMPPQFRALPPGTESARRQRHCAPRQGKPSQAEKEGLHRPLAPQLPHSQYEYNGLSGTEDNLLWGRRKEGAREK